jgi:hypothetical protein
MTRLLLPRPILTAAVVCVVAAGLVLVSEPAVALPNRIVIETIGPASSDSDRLAIAICPAGTVVLGGGALVKNGGHSVRIYWSDLTYSHDRWIARANETPQGYAQDWSLNAYAICGTEPAGYQVLHYDDVSSPGGSYAAVTATCPDGKKAIGAGAYSDADFPLHAIRPSADLKSSFAEVYRDETPYVPGTGTVIVVASVICVTPMRGLQRAMATTDFGPAGAKAVVATCPAGTVPHMVTASLAGGSGEVYINTMVPGLNSAIVDGREDVTGFAGNWSLSAIAICAP